MQTTSNIEIDWSKVKAGLMAAATGFVASRSSIAGAENIATGLRIIAGAIVDVAEEEQRAFKKRKDDFVAALALVKSPREFHDLMKATPAEIKEPVRQEIVKEHLAETFRQHDLIFPEKTTAQLNDENNGYRE